MIARQLPQWTEPEAVFPALRKGSDGAFWLDSSRSQPGLARFSFLGAVNSSHGAVIRYRSPTRELWQRSAGAWSHSREALFDFLAREVAAAPIPDVPFAFHGGLVGYFGYEWKGECGATRPYLSHLPDAAFFRADTFAAFDHLERCVWLVGPDEASLRALEAQLRGTTVPALPPPFGDAWELRLGHPRQRYKAAIDRCQRLIREGESYELCLTNRLEASCNREIDPFDIYRHLRRINPAPYAAFLDFGDFCILSSSPERFLQISADGWVESKPIKGTRRRGATGKEDAALVAELASALKDRSENLMITDLLRNDLGRVCRIGSVSVPKLMDVETYATVHQLVSTIRGHLRPGLTALDCIRAAFPGGSMTGAPKLRSMSLLDELEGSARGPYSGAIGYLSASGAADLSIAIRTIVSERLADQTRLSLGTGGAIVALSDAETEFEETLLKLRAQLAAIVAATTGDPAAGQVDSLLEALRHSGHVRLECA